MRKELSTNEEIAIIKTDLIYIKKGIDEIKSNLKEVPTTYATKEELKEIKRKTEDNTKWIIKYGKDIAYISVFVFLFGKSQGWF